MTFARHESLQKRTAVVTGASSGIGAAIARTLAGRGARVALLARRQDRLKQVAKEIADMGGEALVVPADITSTAELADASERLREAFGPADLLVNSAGTLLVETAEGARFEDWQRLVDINVNGVLRTVEAFLPDLLFSGAEGRPTDLVTISSVSAGLVNPLLTAYGMSKASISHMSANLRAELGPKGVRVTAVEPAVVRTELLEQAHHPLYDEYMRQLFAAGNALDPEDVADVVEFVVSRPPNVNLSRITVHATHQP